MHYTIKIYDWTGRWIGEASGADSTRERMLEDLESLSKSSLVTRIEVIIQP